MAKNCRLDTDIGELKALVSDSKELDALYKQAEELIANARKKGEDPIAALEAHKAVYIRQVKASQERILSTRVRNKAVSEKIQASGNQYESIFSLLHPTTSGKNSIGEIPLRHMAESNYSRQAATVAQALDQIPGAAKALETGELDLKIRQYIAGELPDADNMVKGIGDAIKKGNMRSYNLKKAAGFDLGFLEGRSHRQVHNAMGMTDLGKQEYISLALREWDWDAMGVYGKADKVKWADEFFDKVTSGRKSEFEIDDSISEVVRDRGKRFEESKKIKFKSAESSYNYDKAVNKKTLSQMLADEWDLDSRQLAAAQQFGPNHKASFEKLISEANIDETQAKRLQAMYQTELTGRFKQGTSAVAKGGAMLRSIVDMSRLDRSLLPTLTDLPLSIGTIVSATDSNMFTATKDVIGGFFANVSKSERRKVAEQAHLYLGDMVADAQHNRFGGDITGAGSFMTAMHKGFMKYTGLSLQSQMAKLNNAKVMMGVMGEMASSGKKFDELPTGLQDHFTRYGISAKDWEKIAPTAGDIGDGRVWLSPEKIAEAIGTDTGESLRLQQAISSVLQTVAERGSPTATGAEMYWKNLIDPNTVMGQTALFAAQYKSFSWAALRTMTAIKGTKQTSDAKSWAMLGGTFLAASATGFGVMALRNIMDGKEPPELNAGTILQAVEQGGAGGFASTMVLTDWNNSFSSVAETIGGPAYDLVQDMLATGQNAYHVAQAAIEGNDRKKKQAANKILKAVYNNSPKIPLIGRTINRNILEALQRSMDLPVMKRKGKK